MAAAKMDLWVPCPVSKFDVVPALSRARWPCLVRPCRRPSRHSLDRRATSHRHFVTPLPNPRTLKVHMFRTHDSVIRLWPCHPPKEHLSCAPTRMLASMSWAAMPPRGAHPAAPLPSGRGTAASASASRASSRQPVLLDGVADMGYKVRDAKRVRTGAAQGSVHRTLGEILFS
jgi:hypothetical protein